MTAIPTRWRTALQDQLQNAADRMASAHRHLEAGNGIAAMQEAYPAAVAGATIRVWQDHRPWEQSLTTEEMHRSVCRELPRLFAALTEGDVQRALTSPWRVEDAQRHVAEADAFLADTRRRVAHWLETL